MPVYVGAFLQWEFKNFVIQFTDPRTVESDPTKFAVMAGPTSLLITWYSLQFKNGNFISVKLGTSGISESEKAPKCNGLLLVSFNILMGYVATQYHLPWIRECFGERRNNSTVRVSLRKNTDLITDSLGSSISEKGDVRIRQNSQQYPVKLYFGRIRWFNLLNFTYMLWVMYAHCRNTEDVLGHVSGTRFHPSLLTRLL